MNKNFFSLHKNSNTKKISITSIIIGICTGFFNGLFGSGGGAIVVPALEKFLGFKAHKAHATAVSITLPISIVSLFVYFANFDSITSSFNSNSSITSNSNISLFSIILYVSIGGVLGAYIGAKFLRKIPSIWLHRIFGIFMLIGAWRMLI